MSGFKRPQNQQVKHHHNQQQLLETSRSLGCPEVERSEIPLGTSISLGMCILSKFLKNKR